MALRIEIAYKKYNKKWELAIQKGDLEEHIDNHLYDLHKRVWNSSKIIPERLERYENAVESYRSLGFDIGVELLNKLKGCKEI